ncbi:Zn-dependent hydrolase [Halomarina pelagica]|uniref:Zn-dependent hydrolase n=1 Tax=Halomarina pelagica TaxID=2961599 RepID=UPI0020C26A26|nr:Zn-dependent hydrolase [Halomarina sp. BND7]
MEVSIDRDRFVATMREQAEFGATAGGGLHRLALSDADGDVRDWFRDRMERAGLAVRIDEFGNVFGRRGGTDPAAAPVLVGSHLDSQPYGGIYDGALGVVAALELVRALNDADAETTRPIEIVNWTNEEGSRFQPAMQGSGVWVGEHDVEEEYEKTDANGERLVDELERIGYRGDRPAEPPEEYEAYLELHVEQGPYLEDGGYEVGVVTGVVGFVWGAITYRGEADHSGPTPMHYRRDALVAAADVVTGARRIPSTLGERTVGTVGHLDVEPNSINVVPEEVTFTFDFRDPSDEIVDEALDRVLLEAEAAAEREGVEWEWERRMRSPAVRFSEACVGAVQSAADSLGLESRRIVSGAGHDAAHLAAFCDTGMVFAVSENGKSHTEREFTSWEDCYNAANALARAAVTLATDD